MTCIARFSRLMIFESDDEDNACWVIGRSVYRIGRTSECIFLSRDFRY